MVQRLRAWSRHEANRLVKASKLHFLDAGLQAALTRLSPELLQTQRVRWGATLETWVYAELRKAFATALPQDLRGLRRLQSHAGDGFLAGVVLYDGPHALRFGDGLWAIPLAAL